MEKKGLYFSKLERVLYALSLLAVVAGFFIFDRKHPLYLVISVVGVVYLAFCAKGHPVGQALVIVFSILYGIVSFYARYYGEMITYIGMTGGLAVVSLVSWLKNPTSKEDRTVKIDKAKRFDYYVLVFGTIGVTAVFYFVLKALNTENLIFSTLSVATSFAASYLSLRRNKYYAIAYALNDAVLIVLWSTLSVADLKYVNLVVCFAMFFINDIYGFISWHKRDKGSR